MGIWEYPLTLATIGIELKDAERSTRYSSTTTIALVVGSVHALVIESTNTLTVLLEINIVCDRYYNSFRRSKMVSKPNKRTLNCSASFVVCSTGMKLRVRNSAMQASLICAKQNTPLYCINVDNTLLTTQDRTNCFVYWCYLCVGGSGMFAGRTSFSTHVY